jgi:hypothetical protein
MTAPSVRRDDDMMARLDAGLARAARSMDADIAEAGSAARVVRNVLAGVSAHPVRRGAWLAIAAALVAAAGLGSLADMALLNTPASLDNQEVVVLDPLVFGPAEVVEQR